MLAQQLGLLLEGVLRGLEATDDHRVHDPGDLKVGQLAVERLVVDVAQEADHVVLRILTLRGDMVVDVLLEAVEAGDHLLGLFRRQFVSEAGAVDERGDDGVTPLGELWDVGLGKAEDARHHTLWQRPRRTGR